MVQEPTSGTSPGLYVSHGKLFSNVIAGTVGVTSGTASIMPVQGKLSLQACVLLVCLLLVVHRDVVFQNDLVINIL